MFCCDLDQFVEETHSRCRRICTLVTDLWSDTGLDQAAQAEATAELSKRVNRLLDDFVGEHEDVNVKHRGEVFDLARRHQELKISLGAVVDDGSEDTYRPAFSHVSEDMPLLQQRQCLQKHIGSLLCLESERRNRVAENHATLCQLYERLGTPLADRLAATVTPVVQDAAVTSSRLFAYAREIKARREELRSSTMNRIRDLGQQIQNLSIHLELDCPVNMPTMLELASNEELQARLNESEFQLAELQKEKNRRVEEKLKAAKTRVQTLQKDYDTATGNTHVLPEPVNEEDAEAALHHLESRATDLESRIREVADAMTLLKRREELLAEQHSMSVAQSDPNRLTSKQRGFAKQLLHEERMRRALRTELPKINEQLSIFLAQWNTQHPAEPFIYRGVDLKNLLPTPTQSVARKAAPNLATPIRLTPTSSVLGKRPREPLSPIEKRQNAGIRSPSACPLRLRTQAVSARPQVNAKIFRSDSASSLFSSRSTAIAQSLGNAAKPVFCAPKQTPKRAAAPPRPTPGRSTANQ